jgi:S1-C subfamily serine protease
MAMDQADRRDRPWACLAVLRSLVLMGVAAGLLAVPLRETAGAQGASVEQLLSGVVRIKTFINPDGRTSETLGREREGSGIVIGSDGLIVTIGYLVVEAQSAEVTDNDGKRVSADIVGYDYDTGFGLLRAAATLATRPVPIGKSGDLAVGDRVLVAAGGGLAYVGPATVAAKRPFAGSWEYLLEEAIFTTPPMPWWSGAALLTREGKLVGVGSLVVGDASGMGRPDPGNMFVPVDRLLPILAELIADGRVSGPARPWVGLTTEERDGRLVVQRVARGGPAEKAGIAAGDVVVAVGSVRPRSLAELYRAIWSLGNAGVTVPMEVSRKGAPMTVEVRSMNRLDHLKLGSSF